MKQAEGGTLRDGTYTLDQGGTGGVELRSNSNSADAGGFRFATLHGTLATGANLNGNGGYVSAAESNGATSQTGAVNIIGTAKLNANGSEGSFSRTTTATGESWSGTRVTSTDTGNGTTSHGGTVKIDENGDVTATGLSNSETGGGTRTTVYYSYSGSYDAPSEGNRSLASHERTDAYTTTTNNTAGSKNSTDTHEWEETSFDDTVITTDNGVYGWEKELIGNYSAGRGIGSQTVTLSGPVGSQRASATITSRGESLRESSTGQIALYLDPGQPAGYYVTVESQQGTRIESSGSSEYHSNHQIDANGLVHGGTFHAESKGKEIRGEFFDADSYVYYAGQHETSNQIVVHSLSERTEETSANERGGYEDWGWAGGAIRVQTGSYDTELTITTSGRYDEQRENIWSDPAYHGSWSETRDRRDDTSRTTTEGWYDPYDASETRKFSRELVERHLKIDQEYDHFWGTTTTTDRYELDLSTDAGRTTGHEYHRNWTVGDSGTTENIDPIIDRDIFEGQSPPAAPKTRRHPTTSSRRRSARWCSTWPRTPRSRSSTRNSTKTQR